MPMTPPVGLRPPLHAAVLLALALTALAGRILGADVVPFPVPAGDYRGYAKHEFVADGQHLLVVEPAQAAVGRPWIWRCEFFDH